VCVCRSLFHSITEMHNNNNNNNNRWKSGYSSFEGYQERTELESSITTSS
jgi:hypothetical protein